MGLLSSDDLQRLNDPVKRFLSQTKLQVFSADQPRGGPDSLITVPAGTTVGEAMKVLAENGILSAPVKGVSSGEYVGILDVSDILKGLLKAAYPELLSSDWVESHHRTCMAELDSIGPDFTKRPVEELLHEGSMWFRGDPNSQLLEVVRDGFRILPKKSSPKARHGDVRHRIAMFSIVHGAPTIDGPTLHWRVDRVVSQSDVLRLLHQNAAALGPVLQHSLEDLGLVRNEVATVPASYPTLSAFAKMRRDQKSSLGVTANGSCGGTAARLMANLSMSDLRGLLPERFAALALPVGDFLAMQHHLGGYDWDKALFGTRPQGAEEGRWDAVLAGLPLLALGPRASLGEAIQQLTAARVHRLYVVDEAGAPIGIVTPTDVLRLLTS